MKVLYRLGYYLGGFAIGLVLLAFFLKGSGTSIPSCDYLPNDRVLKTLRSKPYSLSPKAKRFANTMAIDTTQINNLLKEGEVIFSKSEPRKEPCGLFYIEYQNDATGAFALEVDNCENELVITNIEKI